MNFIFIQLLVLHNFFFFEFSLLSFCLDFRCVLLFFHNEFLHFFHFKLHFKNLRFLLAELSFFFLCLFKNTLQLLRWLCNLSWCSAACKLLFKFFNFKHVLFNQGIFRIFIYLGRIFNVPSSRCISKRTNCFIIVIECRGNTS